MRDRCDIKIFLDMDEDLRRYLKIQRDVHLRGHSIEEVIAVLESRTEDAERFIKPPEQHADVVFRISPTQPIQPDDARPLDNVPLQL